MLVKHLFRYLGCSWTIISHKIAHQCALGCSYSHKAPKHIYCTNCLFSVLVLAIASLERRCLLMQGAPYVVIQFLCDICSHLHAAALAHQCIHLVLTRSVHETFEVFMFRCPKFKRSTFFVPFYTLASDSAKPRLPRGVLEQAFWLISMTNVGWDRRMQSSAYMSGLRVLPG